MERSSEVRLPAQGTNPAAAEAASATSSPPTESDPMSRLNQETIAIIGVGIALGALILTTTGGLRDELRAVRAEARADREAIRAEARADREAFEEQIIRLTEQQGALGGLIEGLRLRQLAADASDDRPPG